ncbi:MAG: hypothetical protein CML02_01880 [Pseudooceanicola sp.]|jgi:putative tricarboxylic transport membrane protein|nr:hypothetical protein [Pseudooceanicola sp.]|tara:strand:- start:230 stop:649 length:420 start_codon:yes stop_codon:yes gene_type:complete
MMARLSGLAVAGFGVLLLAWLIPVHTETVGYGWLRPQTLPRACAVALLVLGLALTIWPGPAGEPGPEVAPGRLALVIVVVFIGVWAMSRFGFLPVAPVLAALLVLICGERRWAWIALGVGLAPVLSWLVVDLLLNRSLP